MKKTVVIAAIASRAYVQAAVAAGFDVIALDAFADVDTQLLAKIVVKISVLNGQFDADQVLNMVNDLKKMNCIGFAYGAGFEAQPELLNQIALAMPIIGNTAAAILQLKQPQSFFALCEEFGMLFPQTVYEKPQKTIGWLQKTVGASGGEHIKKVLPLDLAPFNLGRGQHTYYQQEQAGQSVSCLFLADGKKAVVLGFNEQWCSPTLFSPYRFGGAVSQIPISATAQQTITLFITAVTEKIGLKGLNSCDCIIHDEAVFMLEINPRLSASVALFQAKRGDLFSAHVASCLEQLDEWPVVDKKSRAIQIIYANQIAKVPPNMDWPEWVADIPQANTVIPTGMPLCSVMAEARTAKLAKHKVLQRAASL